MAKILINVPKSLKVQLDALREQGTSMAGFIRYLIRQHFADVALRRELDSPKATKKSK